MEASETEIIIDDLARRVAQLTVEAATWRARAIAAEQRLEKETPDEVVAP